VVYLSPIEVATRLGVSTNTIGRAARRAKCGVYTHGGNKLAAISSAEVASLRSHINETSGNPVWIAAFKEKQRRKRR